jgi:hypothetical protein
MNKQYLIFENRCAACGMKDDGARISWRWAHTVHPTLPTMEMLGHIVWAYHCKCGMVTEYTNNPTIVGIFRDEQE